MSAAQASEDTTAGASSDNAKLPDGAVLRYAVERRQSWIGAVYGWVTVSLFSALFLAVPLFTVALVLGMLFMPFLLWPVALVWGLLAVWPNSEWPAFRVAFCRHLVWHWMPIFKLRVVMDGELPPQTRKGYLLGVHPHGIVPLGGLLYMGWLAIDSPGVFGKTAAASIVLKMPIFRQMFTWLGMIPAHESVLRRTLLERNLAVIPGGIAELMMCSRDTEALYLKKRRGFARVAGETGARLVPSYVFGQTQFFSQLATSGGVAARISRAMRMSLTIFWGQFGLPIPHVGRGVCMVFGQPITMTGDPDKDLAEYTTQLRTLFDKYKHYAGYGDKELYIR